MQSPCMTARVIRQLSRHWRGAPYEMFGSCPAHDQSPRLPRSVRVRSSSEIMRHLRSNNSTCMDADRTRATTLRSMASNFVVRLMQELNDADQFARTCGPALLVVCTEQLDWFPIC